jgi:hypothetical protein
VVHLLDFTTDHSLDHGQVDDAFLQRCVVTHLRLGMGASMNPTSPPPIVIMFDRRQ